jgi:hypothetical protein
MGDILGAIAGACKVIGNQVAMSSIHGTYGLRGNGAGGVNATGEHTHDILHFNASRARAHTHTHNHTHIHTHARTISRAHVRASLTHHHCRQTLAQLLTFTRSLPPFLPSRRRPEGARRRGQRNLPLCTSRVRARRRRRLGGERTPRRLSVSQPLERTHNRTQANECTHLSEIYLHQSHTHTHTHTHTHSGVQCRGRSSLNACPREIHSLALAQSATHTYRSPRVHQRTHPSISLAGP